MPIAQCNGLELCYESLGEPDDEPLVLLMGLGNQLISWPEEFCNSLTDRYFRVIRFDNRDCGLSTILDHLPAELGHPEPPYTFADMAADTVGLLDHLEIDSAHLVGISMGGMIAQTLAIDHPERVKTLTSIASTTGAPDVGYPSEAAVAAMTEPQEHDPAAALEQAVRRRAVWATTEHFDERELREFVVRSQARSHAPYGTVRQFAATLASPNREAGLANVDVPTLVVHGDRDQLIHVSGGHRTAEVIPDAELLVLEGLGHDLPPPYWSRVIEAITLLASRAASEAR